MAAAATMPSSPSPTRLPPSPSLPLCLWPPHPSTRSSLVLRLSAHLSSTSFFSQRFGQILPSQASILASRIEQLAFHSASLYAPSLPDDLAVVQFYAKEASRLMLDCLKKGPSSDADAMILEVEATPDREDAEISPGAAMVFDISDGNREFLSEEAAAELLKPLTVAGNSFCTICLSNRSFGEDAARVAAKILEPLRSQILQVNLADIVAGRKEEEALLVMSIFSAALEGCKLRSLNLSDNALGEKGVRAFSALLKSQHALEELYFMNNGISEEAAIAICELLPSSQSLRILHFHNNMTGDAGAIALSKLVKSASGLEDFRFSSTRVATEGGTALAEALLSGCSLKKIDLRDNPLGEEGGIALAKSLKQHMGLKEAYLSYLGLEDTGTVAVLDALKEAAPGLQVLELAGDEITVSSAKKIADCIATKPHLIKLNLSENPLQDKGVVTVCEALLEGHEGLVELDLSETDIGRIGACAAAKAVAQKPDFKLLSINANHITEAGVEAVKDVLQKGIHGTSVLGSLDENEEEEPENEDEDAQDVEEVDLEEDLQIQMSKVSM